jgi:hypothetical protein
VSYRESLANLEKGRGQVRRIAFRTEDGRQVNLLSASSRPVSDLIAVQQNRWRQENGFKHGVERWGINQLDGRSTEPYPEDTIVPNPARSRLDRAIRLLVAREGHLRCALAEATDGDRRKELEAEIARLASQRDEMLALRPTTPARAPLAETVLAGKLVRHDQSYKTTLDTLRIACANAEADLAAMLSVLLPKPAEARKLLAAVFRAPGDVRVADNLPQRIVRRHPRRPAHAQVRDRDHRRRQLPTPRSRRTTARTRVRAQAEEGGAEGVAGYGPADDRDAASAGAATKVIADVRVDADRARS